DGTAELLLLPYIIPDLLNLQRFGINVLQRQPAELDFAADAALQGVDRADLEVSAKAAARGGVDECRRLCIKAEHDVLHEGVDVGGLGADLPRETRDDRAVALVKLAPGKLARRGIRAVKPQED